jgi:PAS domain S-box-containing protein
MDKNTAVNIINNTSLFRHCEDDCLLESLLPLNTTLYQKGSYLLKEKEEPVSLYIILQGDVGLYKEDELIVVRSKYEVIGEQGIIDNEPRSADAVCLSNVEVVEIIAETFINMIKTNGSICYNMLNILSHKLKQATSFRAEILKNERRLEEEIKERQLAESKYRNLFEAVGNPTLLVEMSNRRIIQVNTSAVKIYGYTQQEFSGLTFYDITDDESVVNKIFKNRTLHIPFTLQKRKSGEVFPSMINARFFTAGERDIGVISITDISDIEKAESELKDTLKELKRSNEDLENFAFIVSHDLKNPLSIVTGYLNLMKGLYESKGYVPEEKSLDILNRSMEKLDYMDKMMSNLLAYSKINIKSKNFAHFSLKYLVQSALDMLNKEIKKSNAKINFDANIEQNIFCDRIQIINVFKNLVSNAIKYSKPNVPPDIKIGMEDKEDNWLFYIKDNGIGIDKENFDKVFLIFQRIDTKSVEGNGIGLSFCKKAIKIHNGEIWLESEPGKGSIFYFTIPKKQIY